MLWSFMFCNFHNLVARRFLHSLVQNLNLIDGPWISRFPSQNSQRFGRPQIPVSSFFKFGPINRAVLGSLFPLFKKSNRALKIILQFYLNRFHPGQQLLDLSAILILVFFSVFEFKISNDLVFFSKLFLIFLGAPMIFTEKCTKESSEIDIRQISDMLLNFGAKMTKK